MDQSKKAIGFFVSLAFLVLGFLLITTKQIEPFSDFALLEWQIKLALQGTFHLQYSFLLEDPNFQFFPLPDLFFHVHNGLPYSTFPNFYPIFVSPLYLGFGAAGIKLGQFVLFFYTIFIFYQIKKDKIATILLLFGSILSLYIFLIHETILFFFLEVVILYFYNRKWSILSGFLSMCLIWMRPEMVFSIFLIPFCFPKEKNWKLFLLTLFVTGFIFSVLNFMTLGTYVPLRLVKNSEFQFRLDTSLYLFKIWIEQAPIFVLFVFYFIKTIFQKKVTYQNLLLILVTILMILISPNTGGHNTPRYLFGLIPLYIVLLKNNETVESKISINWGILLLILSIYQSNLLFQKTKELKKISQYQTNTIQEITKIKDKFLVFNNSDFSFVILQKFAALPFTPAEKELLLLRPNYDNKKFIQILTTHQNRSFTFLELPPSPTPLRPNEIELLSQYQIKYRLGNRYQLPNALLPIQATDCYVDIFFHP